MVSRETKQSISLLNERWQKVPILYISKSPIRIYTQFAKLKWRINLKLILNTGRKSKVSTTFEKYVANRKNQFAELNINRSFITPIIRLRSNHYNLNASLFRKNLVDSPYCPCGSPWQNFNHVLFNCPLIVAKGRALRRIIAEKTNYNINDISSVLVKPTLKLCRVLATFCKACNLNIQIHDFCSSLSR